MISFVNTCKTCLPGSLLHQQFFRIRGEIRSYISAIKLCAIALPRSAVQVGYMAGPIAMITMYAIFRRRAELDIRDVTLRTASAAVWFAPLVIFLSERSMWAITAAGVLAASETRLLRSYHDAMLGGSGPGALDGLPPGEIFHLLPSRALRRLPFSALCASATAHAGGVAGLAGYPLPGAMLLGISTAVVAWSSGAMRGWGQQQSTSLARSAFRVTL